jgi:hypothetical protein
MVVNRPNSKILRPTERIVQIHTYGYMILVTFLPICPDEKCLSNVYVRVGKRVCRLWILHIALDTPPYIFDTIGRSHPVFNARMAIAGDVFFAILFFVYIQAKSVAISLWNCTSLLHELFFSYYKSCGC